MSVRSTPYNNSDRCCIATQKGQSTYQKRNVITRRGLATTGRKFVFPFAINDLACSGTFVALMSARTEARNRGTTGTEAATQWHGFAEDQFQYDPRKLPGRDSGWRCKRGVTRQGLARIGGHPVAAGKIRRRSFRDTGRKPARAAREAWKLRVATASRAARRKQDSRPASPERLTKTGCSESLPCRRSEAAAVATDATARGKAATAEGTGPSARAARRPGGKRTIFREGARPWQRNDAAGASLSSTEASDGIRRRRLRKKNPGKSYERICQSSAAVRVAAP